ncbi:hypothetical protein BT63DRAFT_26351 [Microthyrium microscopicum]|uniref:EthD domain-containing protein n=1 Tax=Microthyrium microscopicum TaxID=703497 RepID=A0A6A6URP8_9PEZI|nr:hypothetical protein BT63DRAFT_26351 [Microthyrium microscopicum]
MPYRILAFLSKLPSLSTSEFISYYETKHLPLIISLSGDTLPPVYKRRYTHLDETAGTFGVMIPPADGGAGIDFDVITELVFESLEAYQAWGVRIASDGGGEKIVEDEGKFLVRERTRSYVVEEFVTGDGRTE